MYPTRWVFFKPLPICFSPSSPLSKLPTKTTNVGSKLASLKKSATMDLGSHQVFKGPQGFHGGLTHVALTPPHRFWPNIFPTSNEGNRGNKRMNSPPTLISTVLHNWPIHINIPPWRTVPAKSYGSSPLEEPPLHPLRLLQLGASSFRDSSGRRSCKIAFLSIQYPPTFTILMTTRIPSTINWLVENTTTNPTEFVSQDIFSFRIGNSQSLWWFRLETTSDFVVSPLGQ